MATRELYICVDAEVDGHVPGPYSMVSIGACAAAIRGEDAGVEILDPDDRTFYAELKPISDTYIEKALRVTGLTRAQLELDGRPPGAAMAEFSAWVGALATAHEAEPVLAAFPLGLIWQFTQYYLHQFAGASPFGQSAHYDIKTAYAALAGTAVRDVIRRRMPSALLGPRSSKTGHALEDAKGFADLLAGLLTWQRETP
jgi:hypothetical protein